MNMSKREGNEIQITIGSLAPFEGGFVNTGGHTEYTQVRLFNFFKTARCQLTRFVDFFVESKACS